MNEQEAMETLERLFSDSTNEDYPFTECFAEALTIAIQALEEVQQYRAIGTPEELQDMKSNYFGALSDWRQYRKIGTLEECRTAREKQIPKKVKYEDVGYEQYRNVNVYACICPSCDLKIIKFDDDDVSDKCESCDVEKMFHSSMVHHAYIGLNTYCNRCGQKLDFGE